MTEIQLLAEALTEIKSRTLGLDDLDLLYKDLPHDAWQQETVPYSFAEVYDDELEFNLDTNLLTDDCPLSYDPIFVECGVDGFDLTNVYEQDCEPIIYLESCDYNEDPLWSMIESYGITLSSEIVAPRLDFTFNIHQDRIVLDFLKRSRFTGEFPNQDFTLDSSDELFQIRNRVISTWQDEITVSSDYLSQLHDLLNSDDDEGETYVQTDFERDCLKFVEGSNPFGSKLFKIPNRHIRGDTCSINRIRAQLRVPWISVRNFKAKYLLPTVSGWYPVQRNWKPLNHFSIGKITPLYKRRSDQPLLPFWMYEYKFGGKTGQQNVWSKVLRRFTDVQQLSLKALVHQVVNVKDRVKERILRAGFWNRSTETVEPATVIQISPLVYIVPFQNKSVSQRSKSEFFRLSLESKDSLLSDSCYLCNIKFDPCLSCIETMPSYGDEYPHAIRAPSFYLRPGCLDILEGIVNRSNVQTLVFMECV